MRRAALAVAFLGLIGSGLGCRAVFGCNDCANDPSCQPLPAYANPTAVVGPTQSSGAVTAPVAPAVPMPVPVPDAPMPPK
jgi:hypothetical protein